MLSFVFSIRKFALSIRFTAEQHYNLYVHYENVHLYK